MLYYFQLQQKLLRRHISDFGIHPLVGFLLLPLAFILASVLLFHKTEFAAYIYILVAASAISRLSEAKRNDFLKLCFSKKRYQIVRILENIVVIAPFVVFLIFKGQLVESAVLVLLSVVFAFSKLKTWGSVTIPTPFSKKPFEFTVGFRQSMLGIIVAYSLTVIAIVVGNFNLGIFSMLLMYLICFSYYLNPENEYFIFIFNVKPFGFLIKKIATACLYSTFLVFPIALSLGVFFRADLMTLIGFQLLGFVFLATTILAKYSVYPNQINIPQIIIFALCAWFPPLLLVTIPWFYLQSVQRLKEYLK